MNRTKRGNKQTKQKKALSYTCFSQHWIFNITSNVNIFKLCWQYSEQKISYIRGMFTKKSYIQVLTKVIRLPFINTKLI